MQYKLNRILLSPEADPLMQAAGDVDTSMPRLKPDKLYNMEIADVTSKTNDEGTGMLKITLKTVKDETDATDKPLNKGFPLFYNWVYTPVGELTVDMIKRSGASILKACGLGREPISALRDNLDLIKGKIVCVKVGTRKAKDGYPESSEVRQWVELK